MKRMKQLLYLREVQCNALGDVLFRWAYTSTSRRGTGKQGWLKRGQSEAARLNFSLGIPWQLAQRTSGRFLFTTCLIYVLHHSG